MNKGTTDQLSVEYRDIPGVEGYRAGTDGSIWSCWRTNGKTCSEWHRLKTCRDKYYTVVSLRRGSRGSQYVHLLVARTFLGPCPPGSECRHLNGNGFDGRLENLAYGTHRVNAEDKRRHGTLLFGDKHPNTKLTDEDVKMIRARRDAGEIYRLIAEDFNVAAGYVQDICKGRARPLSTAARAALRPVAVRDALAAADGAMG